MLPSADLLFKDADSYRTEAVSLWFVFVAKPFIVLVYCCLLLHMIIHIHKEELKCIYYKLISVKMHLQTIFLVIRI